MKVLWYIGLFILSLIFSFFAVAIKRKRLVSTVLMYAFGIIMWYGLKDILEVKDPQKGHVLLFTICQCIPMTLTLFLGDSLFSSVAIGLQSTISIMLALFVIGVMPLEVYQGITYNVSRLISTAWGMLFIGPFILMILGAGIWNNMNGD